MNNAIYFRRSSFWVGTLAILGLFLLTLPNSDSLAATATGKVSFDHFKTGFPLTGAHVTVPCETCHIQGTFKGTPKNCITCHTRGSRIQTTTFKPSNHIPTTQGCQQCHTSTASWSVVSFSHVGVTPRQCAQCHNNTIAKGKPSNHMVTNVPCDTCHRTTTWMSASFTHVNVAPGSCTQCHIQGGTAGTFKPSNHIPTNLSCDACHTTGGSFGTSRFTHSAIQGVVPGQCESCHNGSYASLNVLGKAQASPTHVTTTASCDTCHTGYVTFAGANQHAGVIASAGTCANSGCHIQGGAGLPKPTGTSHIPTSLTCNWCHNMTTFNPSTFTHATTQGVVAGQCEICHSGTYAALNVLGKAQASPTHITTTAACDTCHTGYASFAGANYHAGVIASAGTCASSGCHIQGGAGLPKPTGASHIPTSLTCNWCHNMTTFNPSTFTHSATQGVAPGQCETCHSGTYAALNVLGKAQASPTHITTTAACDTCHTGYATFANATFNHTGVSPGSCATCHVQGGSGLAKPSNHIPTTLSCDACHNTSTFATSTFTHSSTQGVLPGQCSNCHNGSYTQWNALGKPSGHVTTTASCDTCHTGYTTFAGATFNHTGVSPGTCSTCHYQGGPGLAAPTNHIPYASQLLAGSSMNCDSCHKSTTSFATQTMNHNNSLGNGSGWCKGCHASGTSYLGSMEKKSLTHQKSTGVTDCSQSGCHRPLGVRGSPYNSW